MACGRPFAVVDLALFARQKFQAIELLGLASLQPAAEALDGVVAARKPEAIDQLLVDRHRVSPEAYLGLDPFAVGLTGRAGMTGERLEQGIGFPGRLPRWPGWGNLSLRAGGHGGSWLPDGGLCAGASHQLADGFAIDAGLSGDLVLRDVALKERDDRTF
jgi:hypothetical protein